MLRRQGITVREGVVTGVSQRRRNRSTPARHSINTPHYASEKVWLRYAVHDIPAALEDAGNRHVEITISQTDTDPFTLHLASPSEPVMPRPLW